MKMRALGLKSLSHSTFFLFLFLCLPLLTGCGGRKTIVNRLEEREANEIIVYLATKNVDATKVLSVTGGGGGGGKEQQFWDIEVPTDQAIEALSYLNQAGYPRRRNQNLLGIFTGAGLVPSEMEQKIRYQAGLAEQIASIIRKIDGILDAEVQISFPEEDPLNPGATKGKITASVYVKHNGILDDPNSHLITKIKRLVAASVTGLDYDNVTVIAERARYSENQPITSGEEEKHYVSVWSLIIAKESLTRFRVIFFSFTFLILLLLIALIWMSWKFYPILKSEGGFKEFFHIKPIHHVKEDTPPPAATEASSSEPPKEEGEKSIADKDVDQT